VLASLIARPTKPPQAPTGRTLHRSERLKKTSPLGRNQRRRRPCFRPSPNISIALTRSPQRAASAQHGEPCLDYAPLRARTEPERGSSQRERTQAESSHDRRRRRPPRRPESCRRDRIAVRFGWCLADGRQLPLVPRLKARRPDTACVGVASGVLYCRVWAAARELPPAGPLNVTVGVVRACPLAPSC
jgi:hypothetical protein